MYTRICMYTSTPLISPEYQYHTTALASVHTDA